MLADGTPSAPMGSLSYKYLIAIDALACISADTLRTFLEPHADWFREQGLDAATRFGPAEFAHLHRLLADHDVRRPEELTLALLDLGGLSGKWGCEEEVQRAVAQRAQGVHDNANVVEQAFREYVQQRHAFLVFSERVHDRRVQRLVEFCPATDRALDGHHDPDLRARLTDDVGRFFAVRNRARLRECRVAESATEVRFEIVRGSIPRWQQSISGEARVEPLDLVAARSDYLIFNKQTRMLAVHALQAVEHDYYRRVLGRVFFANDDHFRVEEVFTGEPLALHGEDALSTVGFPQLERVELRELRLRTRRGSEHVCKGQRVHEELPFFFSDDEGSLSCADVHFVKLAVFVRSRKQPVIVSIKPPNWCSLDRRVGEELVRAFLIKRGFLRIPTIDSPAQQRGVQFFLRLVA